jgi:hypothetical protein
VSFIAEDSAMPDRSIEQRIAALESKVEAIEEQLRLNPPRKATFHWCDRPPLSPEELAAHEEVQRYIREAREAELAEFDRELKQEHDDLAAG